MSLFVAMTNNMQIINGRKKSLKDAGGSLATNKRSIIWNYLVNLQFIIYA